MEPRKIEDRSEAIEAIMDLLGVDKETAEALYEGGMEIFRF